MRAKATQSKKLFVRERDVLRQVRDYLTLKNFFVYRNHQSLGSHKGLSDLTAIKGGRVIWVEIKKPGGKLSDYQRVFRDNITYCGGTYYVVDSLDFMMALEP
jgi:hypothetical protein